MRRLVMAFGLACLGLAPASCARSESIDVMYRPAELQSAAGVDSLYYRLEIAAETLCAKQAELSFAQMRACRDAAVERAVARAGIGRLAAREQEIAETRVSPARVETLAAR
ncbi:MAG: UrcA family protein [Hyphomonadaceae bacterium]